MVKPSKTLSELRESANIRAKRYQARQREKGKKHLTAIVSQDVFDMISEQRDLTGRTTAQVVESAIETAYGEPEPSPILEPNIKCAQTLLDIADQPGTWKERAERLNEQGIKTARGKNWTGDNLRVTVSKIDK